MTRRLGKPFAMGMSRRISTGSDGKVSFPLRNAPAGCYATIVTDIDVGVYDWGGFTPTNEFCK